MGSRTIREPSDALLPCEAVLTESCFLVSRLGGRAKSVLELVDRGFLAIGLRIDSEAATVGRLIERYENVPMSFEDACLVRMSELSNEFVVLTLDSDFRAYRRHGRPVVPTMMPTADR